MVAEDILESRPERPKAPRVLSERRFTWKERIEVRRLQASCF